MKATIRRNTEAEEVGIQHGIAQDPDSPELGDGFFANARPAREVMPSELYTELTATPRRRGPGRKPAKAQVTLRLDQDVIEGLRASGQGWQVRANEALRRLVQKPRR